MLGAGPPLRFGKVLVAGAVVLDRSDMSDGSDEGRVAAGGHVFFRQVGQGFYFKGLSSDDRC